MNCPYCGKEMELGFIQCRDGLTWTPKKQIIAALSSLGRDAIKLINGASENSNTVHAYKCSECCKVIIEYKN